MYLRILSILLIILTFQLKGQDINKPEFEVIDGDSSFYYDLPEIEILEFKNKEDRNQYFSLKRRVLKVYPYALIAKKKLNDLNKKLDSIPKRKHKKRYTKEVTKWIKEEYTDRLKKLTMNDGKVLVKLIYRETNTTSYEIVKSHRGKFNAFFWQTMAKMWDNNLKTTYNPANNREDMFIEHIIIQAKLQGKFK